jgi:hypothetical protein
LGCATRWPEIRWQFDTEPSVAALQNLYRLGLLGEDVIWSVTSEEGMQSSNHILITTTHFGDGIYGKPTGAATGIFQYVKGCAVTGF